MTAEEHLTEAVRRVSRFQVVDAQASVRAALEAARTADALFGVMRMVTCVWQGWGRISMWRDVYVAADRLARRGDPATASAAHLLLLRLSIALRDYGVFAALAGPWCERNRADAMHGTISGASRRITGRDFPQLDEDKVFVIGLSRTGTTSLGTSLAMLGYEAAHFFNPITRAALQFEDFDLFGAFSDTPVCVQFERLYFRYPRAKFVFTTRDLPTWEQSMRTLMKFSRGFDDIDILRLSSSFRHRTYLPQYAGFDNELYFNQASFSEAYRAYEKRVRDFFGAEKRHRFLEMNLFQDEGWTELCGFLGKDRPDNPFPRKNPKDAIRPKQA